MLNGRMPLPRRVGEATLAQRSKQEKEAKLARNDHSSKPLKVKSARSEGGPRTWDQYYSQLDAKEDDHIDLREKTKLRAEETLAQALAQKRAAKETAVKRSRYYSDFLKLHEESVRKQNEASTVARSTGVGKTRTADISRAKMAPRVATSLGHERKPPVPQLSGTLRKRKKKKQKTVADQIFTVQKKALGMQKPKVPKNISKTTAPKHKKDKETKHDDGKKSRSSSVTSGREDSADEASVNRKKEIQDYIRKQRILRTKKQHQQDAQEWEKKQRILDQLLELESFRMRGREKSRSYTRSRSRSASRSASAKRRSTLSANSDTSSVLSKKQSRRREWITSESVERNRSLLESPSKSKGPRLCSADAISKVLKRHNLGQLDFFQSSGELSASRGEPGAQRSNAPRNEAFDDNHHGYHVAEDLDEESFVALDHQAFLGQFNHGRPRRLFTSDDEEDNSKGSMDDQEISAAGEESDEEEHFASKRLSHNSHYNGRESISDTELDASTKKTIRIAAEKIASLMMERAYHSSDNNPHHDLEVELVAERLTKEAKAIQAHLEQVERASNRLLQQDSVQENESDFSRGVGIESLSRQPKWPLHKQSDEGSSDSEESIVSNESSQTGSDKVQVLREPVTKAPTMEEALNILKLDADRIAAKMLESAIARDPLLSSRRPVSTIEFTYDESFEASNIPSTPKWVPPNLTKGLLSKYLEKASTYSVFNALSATQGSSVAPIATSAQLPLPFPGSKPHGVEKTNSVVLNDEEENDDYLEEDFDVEDPNAGLEDESSTEEHLSESEAEDAEDKESKWDNLLRLPREDCRPILSTVASWDGSPKKLQQKKEPSRKSDSDEEEQEQEQEDGNLSEVPLDDTHNSHDSASLGKSEAHARGRTIHHDYESKDRKKMLSPGSLRRKLLAHVNLLETLEHTHQRLNELEHTKALALAQHETVSLMQRWEEEKQVANQIASIATMEQAGREYVQRQTDFIKQQVNEAAEREVKQANERTDILQVQLQKAKLRESGIQTIEKSNRDTGTDAPSEPVKRAVGVATLDSRELMSNRATSPFAKNLFGLQKDVGVSTSPTLPGREKYSGYAETHARGNSRGLDDVRKSLSGSEVEYDDEYGSDFASSNFEDERSAFKGDNLSEDESAKLPKSARTSSEISSSYSKSENTELGEVDEDVDYTNDDEVEGSGVVDSGEINEVEDEIEETDDIASTDSGDEILDEEEEEESQHLRRDTEEIYSSFSDDDDEDNNIKSDPNFENRNDEFLNVHSSRETEAPSKSSIIREVIPDESVLKGIDLGSPGGKRRGGKSFREFSRELLQNYENDINLRRNHEHELLLMREEALREKTREQLKWLIHKKKLMIDWLKKRRLDSPSQRSPRGQDIKMPSQKEIEAHMESERKRIETVFKMNKASIDSERAALNERFYKEELHIRHQREMLNQTVKELEDYKRKQEQTTFADLNFERDLSNPIQNMSSFERYALQQMANAPLHGAVSPVSPLSPGFKTTFGALTDEVEPLALSLTLPSRRKEGDNDRNKRALLDEEEDADDLQVQETDVDEDYDSEMYESSSLRDEEAKEEASAETGTVEEDVQSQSSLPDTDVEEEVVEESEGRKDETQESYNEIEEVDQDRGMESPQSGVLSQSGETESIQEDARALLPKEPVQEVEETYSTQEEDYSDSFGGETVKSSIGKFGTRKSPREFISSVEMSTYAEESFEEDDDNDEDVRQGKEGSKSEEYSMFTEEGASPRSLAKSVSGTELDMQQSIEVRRGKISELRGILGEKQKKLGALQEKHELRQERRSRIQEEQALLKEIEETDREIEMIERSLERPSLSVEELDILLSGSKIRTVDKLSQAGSLVKEEDEEENYDDSFSEDNESELQREDAVPVDDEWKAEAEEDTFDESGFALSPRVEFDEDSVSEIKKRISSLAAEKTEVLMELAANGEDDEDEVTGMISALASDSFASEAGDDDDDIFDLECGVAKGRVDDGAEDFDLESGNGPCHPDAKFEDEGLRMNHAAATANIDGKWDSEEKDFDGGLASDDYDGEKNLNIPLEEAREEGEEYTAVEFDDKEDLLATKMGYEHSSADVGDDGEVGFFDWSENVAKYIERIFEKISEQGGTQVLQEWKESVNREGEDDEDLFEEIIDLDVYLELEESADNPEFLQIHNKMIFDFVKVALREFLLGSGSRDESHGRPWIQQPYHQAMRSRLPVPSLEAMKDYVTERVLKWDRLDPGPSIEQVMAASNGKLNIGGWPSDALERMDNVICVEAHEQESMWTRYDVERWEVIAQVADMVLEDLVLDTALHVQKLYS